MGSTSLDFSGWLFSSGHSFRDQRIKPCSVARIDVRRETGLAFRTCPWPAYGTIDVARPWEDAFKADFTGTLCAHERKAADFAEERVLEASETHPRSHVERRSKRQRYVLGGERATRLNMRHRSQTFWFRSTTFSSAGVPLAAMILCLLRQTCSTLMQVPSPWLKWKYIKDCLWYSEAVKSFLYYYSLIRNCLFIGM